MVPQPAAEAWGSSSDPRLRGCERGRGGLVALVSSPLGSPMTRRRSAPLPFTDPSLSFALRISSTLQGENARAILKRSPDGFIPNRSSLGLQVLAENLA